MDSQRFGVIRKGLLEFLILQIVSTQKVYAAEILARLQHTDFATQEGTLYPLLSKMCRERSLDYEWHESDSGPPRKYYMLAAGGRKQLTEFRGYWTHLSELIDTLGQPT
jgi:PadR family transcriptional regulator PadR